MTDVLLGAKDISVHYGKIEAVQSVSLAVKRGQIVTVIGPNGAGKSSLLNAMMGMVASTGSLAFSGKPIERMPVESRVAEGISLVPESRELFGEMTVLENLRLGTYPRFRRGERGFKDDLDAVYDLFPRLQERRGQRAATLSGGERQMLAIGRALMARPTLLMLDEPSLGLAPRIVREILKVVAGLRDRGVSILVVEQNARAALQIADYGYVLEGGTVMLEGPASELQHNESIVATYLGVGKPPPQPPA